MSKLTDAEIVKAFECCKSFDDLRACYKCPALQTDGCASGKTYISDFIIKEILDLLKRKEAEIERLKKENKVLKTNNQSMCSTLLNRARVERAEAIKEFAEKFKHRFDRFQVGLYSKGTVFETIDNLVKEMTEQTTFEKVEHNSLCETETYKGGE